MVLIDLSKQHARNVDLKAMQQINFTGNLEQAWNTTVFLFIEEVKDYLKTNYLRFFKRNSENTLNTFYESSFLFYLGVNTKWMSITV